jgi:D-alanyl-D-alanine carboxypeptidase
MGSMSRRDFFAITTACTAAAAFAAVPASGGEAIHSPPSAAPPEPLRRFIAEYMRAMNAPGLTLALANVQGPQSIAAFGLADLDAKTPVTTLHRFEIGSITKSFAALVILQLQDEGKLDVQHPILRYLPWLPIETDFGEIRIHHLLTHSSGMPTSNGHLLPTEAGARLSQSFQPGSQFHYSNWGFGVLGRLIESIDGVPWPTAVSRRLFAPLGMTDTAAAISSAARARIVSSYMPLHDERPYPRHGALVRAGNLTFTAASGSIASTPLDMARYLQMLLNRGAGPSGRVVSDEGFMLFSTAHIAADEFGPGASYGYGVAVDELDGHRRLRHTGGMASFMSSMQIDLDGGVAAFASVNAQLGYRPNPVTQYAIQVLRAAAERKPPPPAPPADEAAEVKDAAGFSGFYRAPDGRTLEVIAEHDQLTLLADGKRIPLQHVREDQFIAQDPKFSLYLIMFGREPVPAGAAQPGAPAPAVIEMGYGPDWFAHSRNANLAAVQSAPELAPYAGLYCSNDPFVGSIRIVVRRGKLWAEGVTLLTPIGDRLFRFSDEPSSPETAEFRGVIDGRAEILVLGGDVLQRVPEV